MKEVCIISYTSNTAPGGVATYLKEYVFCLKKTGCRINLVELGTDKKRSEFYVKETGNIRTIHFPYLLKGDVDRYQKGVCRLLRLYVEDSGNLVFHLNCDHCNSLIDGLKKNFPLSKSVYVIHFSFWSAALQGDVALFEKIIRNQEDRNIKIKYKDVIHNYKREKSFLEKVDRIVCLSDDTLKMVKNQYGIKQNVWLIPNGLRKNVRQLSEDEIAKLRQSYYLSPEEKILLFVGRIDSIKGIDHLMACFADVVAAYANCRLAIIGPGDINAIVKTDKKVYAKVIFTGELDSKSLSHWYQMADIALFPSLYEECSYVGIEMMMHGLPVISSDGYSVRNMFFDGVNAKVVNIKNRDRKTATAKKLKESIIELLHSDLSTLAIRKGAREMYQSKYAIEHMQNGYAALFDSL